MSDMRRPTADRKPDRIHRYNKMRADFVRRAMMASDVVPALGRVLAWLIAYEYRDHRDWKAIRSHKQIARDLGGVDEKTVSRRVAPLLPLGLHVVPGDGRGRASTYTIEDHGGKGGRASPPFSGKRQASESTFQGQKVDSSFRKAGHLAAGKGDTNVRLTHKTHPQESPTSVPKEEQRADARVGLTPSEQKFYTSAIGTLPHDVVRRMMIDRGVVRCWKLLRAARESGGDPNTYVESVLNGAAAGASSLH